MKANFSTGSFSEKKIGDLTNETGLFFFFFFFLRGGGVGWGAEGEANSASLHSFASIKAAVTMRFGGTSRGVSFEVHKKK